MGYSPWGHKESDMTERLVTRLLFYSAVKTFWHGVGAKGRGGGGDSCRGACLLD